MASDTDNQPAMLQTSTNYFDTIFPVREESAGNFLAVWLDRIIYFFIFLTALAAPISIAATNVGWIAGFFFTVIRLFVRPRPRWRRTPIDIAILAFFAWCLLSSIFSYAPDLSLDRQRVLTLFPIAYLVAQNIRARKTIKFLAGVLIVSCMATVLWTFAERAIGRGVQVFDVQPNGVLANAGIKDGDTLLKINKRRIYSPDEITDALQQNEKIKLNLYRPDYYADVEIPGGFDRSATLEPKSILGFGRWQPARIWRAQGFYDHWTTYAEVLQLLMSLAFGVFVALPNKKSRLGALLFVCLALMSIALLLTATRASQVGFLLSALSIIALGANRKTLIAALAAVLPLVLIAGIYLQQTRNTNFVDAADNSTTWRLTVWREGLNLLVQSPRHLFVGVGIDSVKRFKCEWGLFANCTLPAGHFHSTPLQIAVECGLPALFLWLLTIFCYGRSLLQAVRRIQISSIEKGILLGAFGGLIGFFASGLVHYNLGDSEVAMVFYLIMGLSLVLTRNTAAE